MKKLSRAGVTGKWPISNEPHNAGPYRHLILWIGLPRWKGLASRYWARGLVGWTGGGAWRSGAWPQDELGLHWGGLTDILSQCWVCWLPQTSRCGVLSSHATGARALLTNGPTGFYQRQSSGKHRRLYLLLQGASTGAPPTCLGGQDKCEAVHGNSCGHSGSMQSQRCRAGRGWCWSS